MQKIQDAFSQKIDDVCGPSKQSEMEDAEDLSDNEIHAMQEVLTSLIQQYQNTSSRSQKLTVLERCYEELGIDEIQFCQWTATDS